MSGAAEPTQRLFFALWPGECARGALRQATAKAVRHCGGRPVPAENLHVTLVFLGSVAVRRLVELRSLARAQAAAFAREAPLALRFEELVHWSRPQTLGALATGDVPQVQALATALRDATLSAGFTPDLKPFRAHVTVARKVVHGEGPLVLSPVVWKLDGFALLDSRTHPSGPIYSVIDSYPLVKSENARE
jgi:RNA 2',3'-cyclic 3'-phosphodiesterase